MHQIESIKDDFKEFIKGRLKMEKQLNKKYALSQGLNSGLLASMLVFASVYLLDRGFTSSSIGTILALCSIAAILLQTFFANITEKYATLRLQDMLNIILLVVIVMSLGMMFSSSVPLFLLAVFLGFSFAQATVPFVNSLAFIFEEHNIKISFGVGRGFGSLVYALVVLLLGYVIEWTAPTILPLFYIAMSALLILIIKSYQVPSLGEIKPSVENEAGSRSSHLDAIPVEQQSLKDFIMKYRELFYVVLGTSLVMFGQTMLSTFLIQIVQPIGGDSTHVGMAIFIGAIVEVPILMKFDWFHEKSSLVAILKLSMLFYVVKAFIMMFSSSIYLIYFAQLLQTGSYALAYPAVVQFIKTSVKKNDLFRGQTLFTIGVTMSSVYANFLGGLLIDYIGVSQMTIFAFVATCIGGSIVYRVLIKIPNVETEIILPK